MKLVLKLKKIFVTTGLAVFLFGITNMFTLAAVPQHQEVSVDNSVYSELAYASEIPEGAIVLSETTQKLYFDKETGEQVTEKEAFQRSTTVYEVTASHTIFQVPGGKIDLGIDITASDLRARIKGIDGWMTADDIDSAGSSTQTIKASTIVPSYHFGAYVNGKRSFTRSYSVEVTWYYKLNIIGGSAAGAITGDEIVDIVR